VSNTRQQAATPRYQPGDLVEVRGEAEVRATLDAAATLDGLPWMPEMTKFCGQKFRVFRRVHHVFIDYHQYVAGIEKTVLLDGVRCDGRWHQACRMRCMILWKEAWLRPVGDSEEVKPRGPDGCFLNGLELPAERDERLCCQATELTRASRPLPWWRFGQYRRALAAGDVTLREIAAAFAFVIRRRLRARWNRLRPKPREKAAAATLNLQPGDEVEVKSWAEIKATLDADGKNRGLAFTPEMAQYCGQKHRVADRVDRIVIEWTGEVCSLKDTVTLEGVTCRGIVGKMCPRNCYQLWREVWLRHVD